MPDDKVFAEENELNDFVKTVLEKERLFDILGKIKDDAEYAILIWGPTRTEEGLPLVCDVVSWGLSEIETVGLLDISKGVEPRNNPDRPLHPADIKGGEDEESV